MVDAGVLVNPSADELARFGGVMNGRVRRHHMPGWAGPLSIKSMVRGTGRWRTPNGTYLVEPGQVLVLNHGQPYSLTIDEVEPIETFCPFFAPALVREAHRARNLALPALLDRPDDPDRPEPELIERLRPPTPAMRQALGALRHAITNAPALAADRLLDLLDTVLDTASDERRAIAEIPVTRPSTRLELYRRVHRARDHIHAALTEPLHLEDLARCAAMSPYHFHRMFRVIVGTTPARYIQELRLQRARTLLSTTSRSVTEVCADVGLESLGSFSGAFARRFGRSPSASRRETQG